MFFKPKVTIQVHNGCVAHFFTCSAKKCKSGTRGVRRYQDKGDMSSTANLRHHAIHCFGEDAVNTAVKGQASVSCSGNIFTASPIKVNGRKLILIMYTQALSSGKCIIAYESVSSTHLDQCTHCEVGGRKQSPGKHCHQP